MGPELLSKHGWINNEAQCLEFLERLSKTLPEVSYINSYSDKVSNSVSYLDASGNALDKDSEKAKYKWVSSGYNTTSGDTIYFSFYKNIHDEWKGAFVGTDDFLLERIFGYYVEEEKMTTIKREEAATGTEPVHKYDVYQELYDRLLMKERWIVGQENKLPKYITNLCLKVENQLRKKKDSAAGVKQNGFILNESASKIILNTGLLDRFRNDIYMMFDLKKGLNGDTVTGPTIIINGKIDVFENDFKLPLPEPFKFYATLDELLLSVDIEDFDLSDINRLNHIINERRERFPEEYKTKNEDIIAQKLKTAIETSVKISKRDYKYIIPMYNIQQDCIQYLMPLYLDRPIDEAPELVLVVGKNVKHNICSIMTIISPDDAYLNARLIARPDSTWLNLPLIETGVGE